jgi:four helix bundle protein
MPPRDLTERTRLFANTVVRFCRTLPRTDEARDAARQLRRSAASGRANYLSARHGRSRDEFAARLAIVYEEIDEARDWLEYLFENRIANDPAVRQEALELTKIFNKAVATTRENTRKMREATPTGRRRPPR